TESKISSASYGRLNSTASSSARREGSEKSIGTKTFSITIIFDFSTRVQFGPSGSRDTPLLVSDLFMPRADSPVSNTQSGVAAESIDRLNLCYIPARG